MDILVLEKLPQMDMEWYALFPCQIFPSSFINFFFS
jgi:hypothetical protein